MISTAPGSFAALVLEQIRAWPGELSDRRICYGSICVAEPPEVGIRPPTRWVERMREMGLLRPARVRRMPHVGAAQVRRLEGDARRVLVILIEAGDDGCSVMDLGDGDPSGALERTLVELYRGGYASPPAALWAV